VAANENGTVQSDASGGSNRYSVVLSEEEKRGGHTIASHVAISDRAVLARAGKAVRWTIFGSVYRAVGKFDSLESANDFVNRLLERNQDDVDAVASGAKDDAWLEDRFRYPTGKEALVSDDSETPRFRATYNVGLKIVHDPTSPSGYTVKTAYPLNDIPGEDRR